MPRKLGPKLILSLTILIVAISGVSGYLNFRTQKKQLVGTMILGADQLSRSITGATWHAMLDDDRKAAYEIMRVIADKQGIDRIRMFNREGRLVFSTDGARATRRHQPLQRGLRQLSYAGSDSQAARRRLARSVCHFPRWREDDQHGRAHLQRAFVQQCQLPRPPRIDQGARGCGCCFAPGPRAEADAGHHSADHCFDRAGSCDRSSVRHSVHQAFRRYSDSTTDRRHEGSQRHGFGPAYQNYPPQPGNRRTGGLVQPNARAPEIRRGRAERNAADAWRARWTSALGSCRLPSASWSNPIAWLRSDSLRPAWLTRSTIPSLACSTFPCCSSA